MATKLQEMLAKKKMVSAKATAVEAEDDAAEEEEEEEAVPVVKKPAVKVALKKPAVKAEVEEEDEESDDEDAAAEEDEEEAAPVVKKTAGKVALKKPAVKAEVEEEESDDEAEEEEAAPVVKKSTPKVALKKPAAKAEVEEDEESDDDTEDEEEEAPKKKLTIGGGKKPAAKEEAKSSGKKLLFAKAAKAPKEEKEVEVGGWMPREQWIEKLNEHLGSEEVHGGRFAMPNVTTLDTLVKTIEKFLVEEILPSYSVSLLGTKMRRVDMPDRIYAPTTGLERVSTKYHTYVPEHVKTTLTLTFDKRSIKGDVVNDQFVQGKFDGSKFTPGEWSFDEEGNEVFTPAAKAKKK